MNSPLSLTAMLKRGSFIAAIVWICAAANASEDPALWKYEVEGDFDTVLANLKSGLEVKQFLIVSEDNLAKGLENNKQVFGENAWNTIGFEQVTAVHFCSLVFNHEVLNMNLEFSVLCPFKVVAYSVKNRPGMVTLVMMRPSYLVAKSSDRRAAEIGRRIEDRITSAIKEGVSQ